MKRLISLALAAVLVLLCLPGMAAAEPLTRDELNAWLSAGLDRARALWAGTLDQIRAFF